MVPVLIPTAKVLLAIGGIMVMLSPINQPKKINLPPEQPAKNVVATETEVNVYPAGKPQIGRASCRETV